LECLIEIILINRVESVAQANKFHSILTTNTLAGPLATTTLFPQPRAHVSNTRVPAWPERIGHIEARDIARAPQPYDTRPVESLLLLKGLAMTVFTVLTWNIENTGESKQETNDTADARLNYFAEVVVNVAFANVAVFQEAVGNPIFSASIAADFVKACNRMASNNMTTPNWDSTNIQRQNPTGRRVESFWIFWDAAQVTPATDSQGLLGGSAFNNFPATSGALTTDGRRAFFLVFQVADSQNRALITSYHAPFSSKNLVPQTAGLQALAAMLDPDNTEGIFRMYDLGNPANYTLLLCGDYNINIVNKLQIYEDELLNPTMTEPAVLTATSLKTIEAVQGMIFPNPADYLANGYDNIFSSTRAKTRVGSGFNYCNSTFRRFTRNRIQPIGTEGPGRYGLN
jgi:hypothetical protein